VHYVPSDKINASICIRRILKVEIHIRPALSLHYLTHWTLCSLLVWHKFGREQQRYTLLRCHIMWMLGNRCPQLCKVQVSLYIATKLYWQSMRYLIRRGPATVLNPNTPVVLQCVQMNLRRLLVILVILTSQWLKMHKGLVIM